MLTSRFDDGKLMLGTPSLLDKVSYDTIIDSMGEGPFFDLISKSQLIAMVNWTMLMNMNEIYSALLEKVLPNLGPSQNRHFLFDLADPEKRSDGDILAALKMIAKFQSFGSTTLGLNLKEGQHAHKLLGHKKVEADATGLKEMCTTIRNDLQVAAVVIHPTDCAACATRDGSWYTSGPFCEKPLITTGAGDHFNAGFMIGRAIGLSPLSCLIVAVCFSGSYVRTAQSPSLAEIDSFIRNWK